MAWTWLFIDGKPVFSAGGHPVFVEEGNEADCECCGGDGGGPDPVILTFCNCDIHSLLFTIAGYEDRETWQEWGGDYLAGDPTVVCYTSGFTPCLPTDSTHGTDLRSVTHRICHMADMNGSYGTTDVTGDASNFTGTFHLGTFHDSGDRGLEVCHSIETFWDCDSTHLSGCNARAPVSYLVDETWTYLYKIVVAGECSSCPDDTGYAVGYTAAYFKQVYYKRTRTGAGACTAEGWDDAAVEAACPGVEKFPGFGTWSTPCGPVISLEPSPEGVSECEVVNCPTPATGANDAPGCYHDISDTHDHITHRLDIL
jgi:hypothetical protein